MVPPGAWVCSAEMVFVLVFYNFIMTVEKPRLVKQAFFGSI